MVFQSFAFIHYIIALLLPTKQNNKCPYHIKLYIANLCSKYDMYKNLKKYPTKTTAMLNVNLCRHFILLASIICCINVSFDLKMFPNDIFYFLLTILRPLTFDIMPQNIYVDDDKKRKSIRSRLTSMHFSMH